MAKQDGMTLQAQAMLYACPRCGATPGDSCTKGTGGKVATLAPHNERVEQLREPEQELGQIKQELEWGRRGTRR